MIFCDLFWPEKRLFFLLGIIFFICLFPLNFLVSFFCLISPLFNPLLSFPWLPEACLWKSSQLSWQFRLESQSGVTLSKGLKSLSAKGLKSLSAKGRLSQWLREQCPPSPPLKILIVSWMCLRSIIFLQTSGLFVCLTIWNNLHTPKTKILR